MVDMSSKISASNLIGLVVGFILISVLVPVALDSLLSMTLPTDADPVIATLLQTLLPMLAILGIVMYFVPKFKEKQ